MATQQLLSINDPLAFGSVVDFAPLTIDNSQPVDGRRETEGDLQVLSLNKHGKKMYRQRSPKENYFNKIVTAGETHSSFGNMF